MRQHPLSHSTLQSDITSVGTTVTFVDTVRTLWPRYTLRITVHSHHDTTCATLEVWSSKTLSWNEVVSLQPDCMVTPPGLYRNPRPSRRLFMADAYELLNRARAVLRFW